MTQASSIPAYVSGDFFINRRRLVVEWGHCDPAGIVFHPRFIEYFDWSSALLFEAAVGLKKSEMKQVYGLAGIPIVDLNVRFMGSVSYNDEVDIFSTISSMKRSSFELRHVLIKDGKPAVECAQTRVWCEFDPENPAKLKSCAIPDDVVEKLKSSGSRI